MLFAAQSRVAAAAQRVSVHTDDGVTLAATWDEPATRPDRRSFWSTCCTGRGGTGTASHNVWPRRASGRSRSICVDTESQAVRVGGDPAQPDYTSMVLDVRAARRYYRAAIRRATHARRHHGGIDRCESGRTGRWRRHIDGQPSLLSPSLDYRGLRIEAALKKFTRPVCSLPAMMIRTRHGRRGAAEGRRWSP